MQKIKYTVYFNEACLVEDGDYITVCESVCSLEAALAAMRRDMNARHLENAEYMYVFWEEDWGDVDAYGVPSSVRVYPYINNF